MEKEEKKEERVIQKTNWKSLIIGLLILGGLFYTGYYLYFHVLGERPDPNSKYVGRYEITNSEDMFGDWRIDMELYKDGSGKEFYSDGTNMNFKWLETENGFSSTGVGGTYYYIQEGDRFYQAKGEDKRTYSEDPSMLYWIKVN